MRHSPLPILALLLLSCDPAHLDNGLMTRGELMLHVEGPQGVSGVFAEEVAQWWNEQCGAELLYAPTPTPDITISRGYVEGEEVLGVADVQYSNFDGLILSCDITVSSDVFDEVFALEVAYHEAGHCLGLDDDPNSQDLQSIMASPMIYEGRATPGDCERILERFINAD